MRSVNSQLSAHSAKSCVTANTECFSQRAQGFIALTQEAKHSLSCGTVLPSRSIEPSNPTSSLSSSSISTSSPCERSAALMSCMSSPICASCFWQCWRLLRQTAKRLKRSSLQRSGVKFSGDSPFFS